MKNRYSRRSKRFKFDYITISNLLLRLLFATKSLDACSNKPSDSNFKNNDMYNDTIILPNYYHTAIQIIISTYHNMMTMIRKLIIGCTSALNKLWKLITRFNRIITLLGETLQNIELLFR